MAESDGDEVEVGSPIVRAQLWNLSEDSACFLTENTESCVYLKKLIRKRGRLPRLLAELKTKPHRHERIEFLKQHVLRDTTNKTSSKSAQNEDNEKIPDLQRRKSEVMKRDLQNVSALIEISDGINTRDTRSRQRARFNQEELDSGAHLGPSVTNHADLLGVEGGSRGRNLSVISQTGYFNTEYGNEAIENDDEAKGQPIIILFIIKTKQ